MGRVSAALRPTTVMVAGIADQLERIVCNVLVPVECILIYSRARFATLQRTLESLLSFFRFGQDTAGILTESFYYAIEAGQDAVYWGVPQAGGYGWTRWIIDATCDVYSTSSSWLLSRRGVELDAGAAPRARPAELDS